MHARQHLHFSITSRHVTASEITDRLGMQPDEIAVRGSRLAHPVTPPAHAWTITCKQPGLSVSNQLIQIVARLRTILTRVTALSAELAEADPEHGGACLELVTYLEDHAVDAETPPEEPIDPLQQWALEREILHFLLTTTPAFDLDIYN